MAGAFMVATRTGSLLFIGDVPADGSNRINVKVYRNILSAQIQANLIEQHFIMQQRSKTYSQSNQLVSGQRVECSCLAKSIA